MRTSHRLAYCLIIASSLAGCMSLPKPNKEEMDEATKYMQQSTDSMKKGDVDAAIENLNEAKKRATSNGKFENGKGAAFRLEAGLTALVGHLEFNRGNINVAAAKWYESFEIQYNGLQGSHEIDQKNARIVDAIATGVSAGISATQARTAGQGYYTYTKYNTAVPKPEMVRIGKPEDSVNRMPVPVEAYPFQNVVKLNNNNKSSCTATMISSRIAISAAHCMSRDGKPIDPKVISLRREGFFSSPVMRVEQYFTHQGENLGWDRNRKNDWLILVTETQYDKKIFPRIMQRIPDSIMSGHDKVMLAGYSSDLKKGFYLTLHHGCKFKPQQKADTGVYVTNCETARGSSGASVMTIKPPYNIIAIHTARRATSTDDFHSVETVSPDFIRTLEEVSKKFGNDR